MIDPVLASIADYWFGPISPILVAVLLFYTFFIDR